jgi:tetratricopeptide (TPR) repeat protein
VEGEEFTAEVIAQVCRSEAGAVVRMLSGDLGKIHKLVQARGVEQAGGKRFSHYQFGHNLIQKYLYSTLDPVERVFQHEAVGNALERLHQGQTEAIAVHLARHFQEAGAIEKTIQYLKQAAEAAARVHANTEAIAHYNRAILLAEQVQVSDEDIASLYTGLGRVLELDSSFDQALSTYEKLEKLAAQRANRAMELTSLMARVTILAVPNEIHAPDRAFELGERALHLAGELDDAAAEAKILWSLSMANLLSGCLQEAIGCGERSLALARQHNLDEQTAQTLNDLGGFIYLYSGRIEQARQALMEASELWRELGNTPMLTDSLSKACIAHVYAGDFDQAISLSEEAFRISHSINNLWGQSYSKWIVGEAYRERGEYSKAIEVMKECIHLGEQGGIPATQDYTRIRLGSTYADIGSLDQALSLIQEGLDFARTHDPMVLLQGLGMLARLQVLKGDLVAAAASIEEAKQDHFRERETWVYNWLIVLFAEAEFALRQGQPTRALAVTVEMTSRLRSYNMRLLLPEALYLQGKVLLDLNQNTAARERFTEAQTIARAISSRRTLWRILFALSQLEKDPETARRLLQEARGVLKFILDQFQAEHSDLRETFLKQADVRAVMAMG